MKRKIVILLIIILSICGCTKEKKEIKETKESGFYEIASYLEKENDWMYMLYLEYSKNGELMTAHFTGFNMKYNQIDGFYIPMVDGNGNLIDKLNPKIVGLINDQEHKKEYNEINNYINKHLWTRKITKEDLKDLKLNYYKKEDIIKLYNETIEKNYKRKMGNFEYCIDFIKNDLGYQISIIGDYGYIDKIRIDKKIKDKYLSDIIKTNTATKEQKDLYKTMKEIENYIVKNQSTNIDRFQNIISEEDYKNVNDLLKQIV